MIQYKLEVYFKSVAIKIINVSESDYKYMRDTKFDNVGAVWSIYDISGERHLLTAENINVISTSKRDTSD